MRRSLLLLATLVATAALPSATIAQTQSGTRSGASVPDFSGLWAHPALNALEMPLAGPGPVRNRSRVLTGPQAGTGDRTQMVGDYTNPILQPWAADVVKKFGQISLAGKGYPTPRNQCWPEGVPFVLANYGMQIIQKPGEITILYPFDHQFRQIRMNQPHPTKVTPSWYGDSVGRYEGDTLVIDTVGIKVGRFSMIDWYGTPFTGGLHLVERYRFLDYEATKEAVERASKEHFQFDNPDNGALPDPDYRGPGLQVELTVEDRGAFTTPWTATVTFQRSFEDWLERVCAENTQWYPGTSSAVPMANKADF